MGQSFPNHPAKYGGTALIRPEVIVARLRDDAERPIPDSVILGYSPRLRPLLRERGFTLVSGYSAPWHSVWLREGSEVGVGGGVEGFGFGAPGAAIVIEELATLGVQRFITLGFAGALPNDVDFGDVVLCTGAIRDEGVSHHYVPPARFAYPSESLTDQVRATLARSGSPFFEGFTWTVDAIYRETVEEATTYRDEGVITVEMEAAALFTIAAVRHVEVAGIFTVSDHLLASTEWRPAPDRAVLTEGLRRILDVALRVLSPDGDFEVRAVSADEEDLANPFE